MVGGIPLSQLTGGPAKLEAKDRRSLIKEIREELKPLCAQISSAQIDKSNNVIKQQIRMLEKEIAVENLKVNERLTKDIK